MYRTPVYLRWGVPFPLYHNLFQWICKVQNNINWILCPLSEMELFSNCSYSFGSEKKSLIITGTVCWLVWTVNLSNLQKFGLSGMQMDGVLFVCWCYWVGLCLLRVTSWVVVLTVWSYWVGMYLHMPNTSWWVRLCLSQVLLSEWKYLFVRCYQLNRVVCVTFCFHYLGCK